MKITHTCELILLVLLALPTIPALSGVSQDPSAARKAGAAAEQPDLSQAQRARLSATLLATIKKNTKFMAALNVLDEQGETADLGAGVVLTSQKSANMREVIFPVINKQTKQPGEYGKLVYQESAGVEPKIFFEERNTNKAGSQGSQNQTQGIFGGCDSWTPWSITGTECAGRFFCFSKNQVGMYQTFQRQRQCKKGLQVAYKSVFLYCGC